MNLSPEAKEWIHALLNQEIDKAVAPLHQQIDQIDDWANGVFAALDDLMPVLLKTHPDIANYLEPLWRKASEQYDTADSQGQAAEFHETQPLLEARKMLYRKLSLLKAWPSPALG